jgi:hypothetical protein
VRTVLTPEQPDTVGSVQIGACQGGYAQVFAVPKEENLETEQLFLVWRGGTWQVIDFGTGIDCGDPETLSSVDMQDACAALGLA